MWLHYYVLIVPQLCRQQYTLPQRSCLWNKRVPFFQTLLGLQIQCWARSESSTPAVPAEVQLYPNDPFFVLGIPIKYLDPLLSLEIFFCDEMDEMGGEGSRKPAPRNVKMLTPVALFCHHLCSHKLKGHMKNAWVWLEDLTTHAWRIDSIHGSARWVTGKDLNRQAKRVRWLPRKYMTWFWGVYWKLLPSNLIPHKLLP